MEPKLDYRYKTALDGYYFFYKKSSYSESVDVTLADEWGNRLKHDSYYSEYQSDPNYRKPHKEIKADFEKYLSHIQTYEEAVEKVVNWWAEKSFDIGLNQDNGDTSAQGGFGFALMNMLSIGEQSKVTPEKVMKFKTKFRELLLTDKDFKEWHRIVDVDYHAHGILEEAYNYAEIQTILAPIKSFTRIDKFTNVVYSSFGYRGDHIIL